MVGIMHRMNNTTFKKNNALNNYVFIWSHEFLLYVTEPFHKKKHQIQMIWAVWGQLTLLPVPLCGNVIFYLKPQLPWLGLWGVKRN
jgi:hypothetical protein